MSSENTTQVPHLYEVTILVPNELSSKYSSWLDDHVREMRQVLHGIQKVDVLKNAGGSIPCPPDVTHPEYKGKSYTTFIARYFVESKEQIDDYIANRSAPMRSAAIGTFGEEVFTGALRFSRRIVPVSEMNDE